MTLSRRDFAKSAAFAAAAAALGKGRQLVAEEPAKPVPPSPPPAAAKLPASSHAEAEARAQAIFRKYGHRFTDAHKQMIRAHCLDVQGALDTMRAYPLENGDEPAAVFRPRPRKR